MTPFAHYQKYTKLYEIGIVSSFMLVNALVLATSRIMDGQRGLGTPSYQPWEPFVWELSSALVLIALLPAVHWLYDSRFTNWRSVKTTLGVYFLASVVFSVLHVSGMVAIRELIYFLRGSDYEFGNVGYEFFYEYRKDLLSFILIVVLLGMHRSLAARWQGEANIVSDSEESDVSSDRILIRKLGKEFIVKITDIEWMESCGNYVNLHIGNRIYPTRTTLSKLAEDLIDKGFYRTHRSFGVNLDAIESIAPNTSGNSEVTLKNGKVIPLSRRYREELKQHLTV